MNSELRRRAAAAARAAMNEVLAGYGDAADCYLRDAVDAFLVDVDPDRMDLLDLENGRDIGALPYDVVAVLSDGGRVYVDLEAGKVEVRDE